MNSVFRMNKYLNTLNQVTEVISKINIVHQHTSDKPLGSLSKFLLQMIR